MTIYTFVCPNCRHLAKPCTIAKIHGITYGECCVMELASAVANIPSTAKWDDQ